MAFCHIKKGYKTWILNHIPVDYYLYYGSIKNKVKVMVRVVMIVIDNIIGLTRVIHPPTQTQKHQQHWNLTKLQYFLAFIVLLCLFSCSVCCLAIKKNNASDSGDICGTLSIEAYIQLQYIFVFIKDRAAGVSQGKW